jgi:uncharacterized protein (TIGR04255 family)
MATFAGPLRSPPVVYALCQFRFAPFPHWEETVRQIHESLAERGLGRQDERVQTVAIDAGGGEPQVRAQQRVRFENREATLGYVLSPDQLLTHQSSYTNFEDLCENIRQGFQAVAQYAKFPFITRIGLRYVDLITATSNESVDEYVHPQLRAFAPSLPPMGEVSATRGGSVHLVEWKYSRSRIVFKAYRGCHTEPLPVDLQPITLQFSRRPPKDTESLILDIDHFVDGLRMPPDWLLAGDQIRQLQEPMSQIFKGALTDHAVQRYNEGEH